MQIKSIGKVIVTAKKKKKKKSGKSPTEHGFMDECMDKQKGKVDDPGAYCASIVDKAKGTTKWRSGPKK